MKKLVSVLLALGLMISLAACGGTQTATITTKAAGETTGAATTAGGKDITIGLSMATRDQFLSTMEAAIIDAAKTAGVTFSSVDAQNNANTQISQIQSFVTKGCDAIIVNLVSTDNAQQVIDAAGNVPLVFVNRAPTLALMEGKQTYVGSDEAMAGQYEGEVLAKYFKDKGQTTVNYVMLQGVLGLENVTKRTDSAVKALKDAGLTINAVYQDTAEWDRAKAQTKFATFLSTNKEYDCVICNNDEMALGVIAAMQAAGVNPADKPVVGIDATSAGLAAMDEGTLFATVFQNAAAQGTGSLEAAIKFAKGESVPVLIDIPFELVTKDNYKDYM